MKLSIRELKQMIRERYAEDFEFDPDAVESDFEENDWELEASKQLKKMGMQLADPDDVYSYAKSKPVVVTISGEDYEVWASPIEHK